MHTLLAHPSDHRQDSVRSMVIAERAKQEQAVGLGTATVHHRRMILRPTPPWYRERRCSHSRTFATCEARNEYAVFICIVDSGNITSDNCIARRSRNPATSYRGSRFAEPPVDYSETKRLLAGGIDCDAIIGEKERNSYPLMLLVATG